MHLLIFQGEKLVLKLSRDFTTYMYVLYILCAYNCVYVATHVLYIQSHFVSPDELYEYLFPLTGSSADFHSLTSGNASG